MNDTDNETLSLDEYNQQAAAGTDEEDIHRAVIRWADAQSGTRPALKRLFHVPNGGSRHPAEAKKLREMGVRQGVPDLWLPVPKKGPEHNPCNPKEVYHGLILELKSPSGRVRSKQAWWLQHLRDTGYAVAVAWTFQEARTLITSYLDGEHEPQPLDLTTAEPPRHAA